MNLKYMDIAFMMAEKAALENEVPIGAILVKNDIIVAKSFNMKEKNKSVLEHAELIAIHEASKVINNWRLDGCDLYVTLDPCPMCASAIKQSRISNVYSALSNSDSTNTDIISKIFIADSTNPAVNFVTNLNVEKSKKILNSFFEKQRKK